MYLFKTRNWINRIKPKILDERGIDYKVVKSFFNANGKAVASDSTEGFIKILVSDRNQILGAHIIGSNATEMISEFSLAMSNNLSVENIFRFNSSSSYFF